MNRFSYFFLLMMILTLIFISPYLIPFDNGEFIIKQYEVDGVVMKSVKGEIAHEIREGKVKEIIVFF